MFQEVRMMNMKSVRFTHEAVHFSERLREDPLEFTGCPRWHGIKYCNPGKCVMVPRSTRRETIENRVNIASYDLKSAHERLIGIYKNIEIPTIRQEIVKLAIQNQELKTLYVLIKKMGVKVSSEDMGLIEDPVVKDMVMSWVMMEDGEVRDRETEDDHMADIVNSVIDCLEYEVRATHPMYQHVSVFRHVLHKVLELKHIHMGLLNKALRKRRKYNS
jgi:hypothetical protein